MANQEVLFPNDNPVREQQPKQDVNDWKFALYTVEAMLEFQHRADAIRTQDPFAATLFDDTVDTLYTHLKGKIAAATPKTQPTSPPPSEMPPQLPPANTVGVAEPMIIEGQFEIINQDEPLPHNPIVIEIMTTDNRFQRWIDHIAHILRRKSDATG